jgi:hypothetical protein
MSAPRSASRLLIGTFDLYRRYPLLFLVLAAGVIVPYELIALAATGTGAFSRANASVSAQLFLELADWTLVIPLVSALHVHAVSEVRSDRMPRIGSVALHGLRALPIVAAATIASFLGTAVGFMLLVVPGVILWLRWAVVAQAAAIEHEGWLPALSRSDQLTQGHYRHVCAFLVVVGVIAAMPFLLLGVAFWHHDAGAAPFLAGLAVRIVTASFAALAGALLYYDLLVRWEAAPSSTEATPPRIFDPRAYGDPDRPKGWYVDPTSPNWMRYWGGDEQGEWSGRTRTPRKIRRSWRAEGGTSR